MPAQYEAVRDRLLQEKIKAWNRRHPQRNLSKPERDRLLDNAQSRAAAIYVGQGKSQRERSQRARALRAY